MFRRNNAEKTFCGLTQPELEDVMYVLCSLDAGVDMSDTERRAMGIAIQLVSHIQNVMQHNEKLHWD